jgi:hypothetical protein
MSMSTQMGMEVFFKLGDQHRVDFSKRSRPCHHLRIFLKPRRRLDRQQSSQKKSFRWAIFLQCSSRLGVCFFIRSQKVFLAKVFFEADALEQHFKLRPTASLHKGGGIRPPPTEGAGRSAARPLCGNPLWRLAFSLS